MVQIFTSVVWRKLESFTVSLITPKVGKFAFSEFERFCEISVLFVV